ncbi:MAG TPA: SMP-30/gluconolactonase/LRE family protein [Candidatus Methylacidiphilales bacterium]|jgi:sugar lactone lactonase YvrE|nr:SMP-30/gluconolactonase/LRE family protein [Candidatus Methylacidiphilales bacterium]
MSDDSVSTVSQLIAPPSAPEVLVEDAGRAAQNLCWDDRDDSLWWTDAEAGAVYRLNLGTRIQSAVYEGPTVGAFLPQEDHTWLLFRDKDIALLDFERHAQVVPLVENVRFDGDRFNEAIADAHGRVLVGTVRHGRPNGAGVYRLDRTGTLAKVLGGTGQSNGMVWNAKGDALYWTCGTTKTICRCKYDERRGTPSNRQVFHECMPEEGTPAGLAIDVEGTLWSARRDAGVILKIGENRRLMGQVTFPAKHVTSLAFGGADHRTLFVSAIVEEGRSKIFILQSPVAGAPVHRSRIERATA